jgi:hypothetical protein
MWRGELSNSYWKKLGKFDIQDGGIPDAVMFIGKWEV